MSTLNLTRKFRIHTFEEIVGQSLVVRMLKNSLYIDRLFPVYLFFGQHGCGKTSIARIFSMAINCKALRSFRTSPKQQLLPCLACDSCLAMQNNSHLDFVEIDAASYTGVDNIRSIIESASYLPVIGSKKIYLIDEAHMLSKAAFNALLKILEEPPANVIFMLATTDIDKIIDTVRSRCFQLFLQPISSHDIRDRLMAIVKAENIPYNNDALLTIAGEANGSVRDALNLIERIRCAYPKVTIEALYQVLGKVPDKLMEQFLIELYEKNSSSVLMLLSSEPFINASPTVLWRHIFQLLRATWYAKQGVDIHEGVDKTVVQNLKKVCSVDFIGNTISFLYKHELHFLQTHAPRFFIEHLCLLIATDTTNNTGEKINNTISSEQPNNIGTISEITQLIKTSQKKTDINEPIIDQKITHNTQDTISSVHTTAQNFIHEIKKVVTPIIHSLLSQAIYTQEGEKIIISLPHSALLLKELLQEAESVWLPVFHTIFGQDRYHFYQFISPTSEEKKHLTIESKSTINQLKKKDTPINFSDSSQWPQVGLLLKHFPGTATIIEQ